MGVCIEYICVMPATVGPTVKLCSVKSAKGCIPVEHSDCSSIDLAVHYALKFTFKFGNFNTKIKIYNI